MEETMSALPSAIPEELGFSPERLNRIGSVLGAEAAKGRIPGAVALVARRGKIAYHAAVGKRDPAGSAAMTEDSIFRVYSMTKPIVSVAAMMLVEQGKLLLAEPLAKFVPEFSDSKVAIERGGKLDLVPAERGVTVQDLLRHTSGITYVHIATGPLQQLYQEAKVASRDQTNADLAARLGGLPLAFQPGARWRYGHSTDLLGRVVEVVTGQRLSEALASMILGPLGMGDTGFHVRRGEEARLAEPFAKDPEGGVAMPLIAVKSPPQLESGGGGLVSTAGDYARFLAMLAGGGTLDGVRLLGPKTIEQMRSDHLGEAPGEPPLLPIGYGFGLGFAVRRQAGLANFPGSAGEYYWSGAAGTAFWIDPKEELFVVLMMQGPNQREAIRMLFRNLVYAAIIE
jgi:CubicO group peptidase (beta-lactamase class C family)